MGDKAERPLKTIRVTSSNTRKLLTKVPTIPQRKLFIKFEMRDGEYMGSCLQIQL